jgi:hypothetical protein
MASSVVSLGALKRRTPVEERSKLQFYMDELRESAEAKAQRIVAEEMKRWGWKENDLGRHRKGDRRKVKIARRLPQEATMALKWIADRLKIGTWTHVTNHLYHLKNQVCVNTQD